MMSDVVIAVANEISTNVFICQNDALPTHETAWLILLPAGGR